MSPLILASGSPRRQQLLARLELAFRVVVPQTEEDTPAMAEGRPEELAELLALTKAETIAKGWWGDTVLAADTIVVDGETILGKPADEAQARAMLDRLRGRQHRVITGLAVVNTVSNRRAVSHVVTPVRMRGYSDHEIAAFVASGAALDKAGAYAIQDRRFSPVASYDGCYCNVVGFPLKAVVRLLREVGFAADVPEPSALPPECAGCPIAVE
jgi:MAF protein